MTILQFILMLCQYYNLYLLSLLVYGDDKADTELDTTPSKWKSVNRYDDTPGRVYKRLRVRLVALFPFRCLPTSSSTATAMVLSELAAEVLVPVAAAVGIAFAVVQWVLVSRVRLSPDRPSAGGGKNGVTEGLIEDEEGLNEHNVVAKCAEIQSAISEGRFVRSCFFF